MENQNISPKSTIISYGIILGVLSIILSVAVYALGIDLLDQPTWIKIISYLIFIAAIILGIKKFKELNGGNLTLGQAIKTGVGISLIGGIISALYTFIFFNFIEPDMINKIMEMSQEKMLEQNPNMTDDQVETAMGFSKMFMTPFAMSTFAIIGSLIMGLIVSLVGGLIMKKESNEF